MLILTDGKLKENKVNPPEEMPPSFNEHKKSHFDGELTMPGYAMMNPQDRLNFVVAGNASSQAPNSIVVTKVTMPAMQSMYKNVAISKAMRLFFL